MEHSFLYYSQAEIDYRAERARQAWRGSRRKRHQPPTGKPISRPLSEDGDN